MEDTMSCGKHRHSITHSFQKESMETLFSYLDKGISETNNLWYNILKYNTIFFYAGAGECASQLPYRRMWRRYAFCRKAKVVSLIGKVRY